ncbi:cytochrome D ubiquinol oxidase subunit II [Actinoplanes sp. SE50]|uniref:cytochrome d ubiquinol oxidase subunit II n=1 Tax=unclassified Actinoplanes TaxID=2626549 RepID=UPI00023ED5C3|nr:MULTISPECIES: cytochrome d ubiquinol oxidase subunit II [unclassified Actinoplanes]AEV83928.1 cytochrome bd-I oxidase subunit II [Actinoplanes sp. SE50/110]ATO81928.1 cytochrome D ubiquinol oxidase subunit II [Actinoplanes sp. SE50]SLL99336.1 cytochrome D ubiquinol oxidase subunit II [Actinoplanes sp. SE50/110]
MITFWFAILVLAWVLYFVLEGFDFGVGLLAPMIGRDDHERAAAIRTIGPFWDGNEVWLVAAIGVTFAAFPSWYAVLLSALYLPMVGILLLLAVRGVALEFRGKHDSPAWRHRCDLLLAGSSAGVVLLWGAQLGIFVRGLALGPDGAVTGHGLSRSLAPLFSVPAGLGALAALLGTILLGATFLALRTTGPVRRRAVALSRHGGNAGTVLLLLAGLATGSRLTLVAAVLCFITGMLARQGREALAFTTTALTVTGAIVAVFTAHGAVVLRSTLSPLWSLTRESAAAGPSALRLITVAGVLILPGVVAYQAWSYWVFRRRIASERIPS